MHRVFKAETKPCQTLQGQQKQANRWVRIYNTERPHEGIGQRCPQELYEKSSRRPRPFDPRAAYPPEWPQRRVRLNGDIKWAGRTRHVGRAFIGQWVALKPVAADQSQVYFANQLIGEMHRQDPAGMRPARWAYQKNKETKNTEVSPMS